MAYNHSEILFNKKRLKTLIEQTPHTAKRIFYILAEINIVEKSENSAEMVSLYTKRVNGVSRTLVRKILHNDFRPFEFLVNRN